MAGNAFGDDVELAVPQVVVDDETDERLAVHSQTGLLGCTLQIGFGFTGERGVVAEEALVVIGVDQHGVERGSEFLASADHLLAAHLLFGLFRNLNRRDGSIEQLVVHTVEAVFNFVLKTREESHVSRSLLIGRI